MFHLVWSDCFESPPVCLVLVYNSYLPTLPYSPYSPYLCLGRESRSVCPLYPDQPSTCHSLPSTCIRLASPRCPFLRFTQIPRQSLNLSFSPSFPPSLSSLLPTSTSPYLPTFTCRPDDPLSYRIQRPASIIQHQRAYPSLIAPALACPVAFDSAALASHRITHCVPSDCRLLFARQHFCARPSLALLLPVENNAYLAIYTCSALHRSFNRRIASRVSRLCDRALIGSNCAHAHSPIATAYAASIARN